MKMMSVVLATVAATVVAGSAFAQDAQSDLLKKKNQIQGSRAEDHRGSAKYRPLTVSKLNAAPLAPAAGAADAGTAVGGALAAPFNAIGGVGGPVGVAGSVAGGAVSGATSLAFAPLAGLTGGSVGISPVAAPPLPIEARYANTGKVFSSYDEGYSQDVPVDASGPIYKINDKAIRTVTPFTLAAFPLTAATSVITSPFRRAPVVQ